MTGRVCARAEPNGHAANPPPSRVINLRRLIVMYPTPERGDTPTHQENYDTAPIDVM